MRRFMAVLAVFALCLGAACHREVRAPAVSGEFYPSDPAELARAVDGYISGAPAVSHEGELVMLVAPHAGYVFSGAVAGYVFRQVAGRKYDTVIILGPSHHFGFDGASVYTGDAVATPLGEVKVDKETAESLLDPENLVVSEPRAHEKEHSMEVELPFLQRALGDFRVVMVAVGSPSARAMGSLAGKIAGVVAGGDKRTLVVVSTDWSHYHDYDTAVRMDSFAIETFRKLSSFELMGRARAGEIELCGIFPAMLASDVANRVGADEAVLYRYANSGDVTGERGRVVGYAAMGVYRTGREQADGLLTGEGRARLLKIARLTVEGFVATGDVPAFRVDDPALQRPLGAFVTLKKDGMLRGCIGRFYSDRPLYDTVREMAVSASSFDRRFSPVSKDELGSLEYEISVLSPMRKVASADEITVGKHGLHIVKGGRSGVLLPQVPLEFGWDRETFLKQTCLKAGLPPDAWKEGAELYTFTAEVFGDGTDAGSWTAGTRAR